MYWSRQYLSIDPKRLNLSTAGRLRISISLFCLHISISLWSHKLSNGYLIVEVLDYSVIPCFTLYPPALDRIRSLVQHHRKLSLIQLHGILRLIQLHRILCLIQLRRILSLIKTQDTQLHPASLDTQLNLASQDT